MSSSTPTYFQTMSPAPRSLPPTPQPSALPPSASSSNDTPHHDRPSTQSPSEQKVKPIRKPLLRLELRDLSNEGTRAFLRLVHASLVLEDAVDTVLRHLYTGIEKHYIPPTRSVTLVLRSMPGVAYTTGSDLDNDHKEIHFSTDYINQVANSRKKEEIHGVIVHEMVHCWQHSALDTAPGGLIEGIADWVRLKAGFVPPHWKRTAEGDWDAGYECTGFFLEWLESVYGEDIVRKINASLRDRKYEEDRFWHTCCGKSINHLWQSYRDNLGVGKDKEEDEHTIGADGENAA